MMSDDFRRDVRKSNLIELYFNIREQKIICASIIYWKRTGKKSKKNITSTIDEVKRKNNLLLAKKHIAKYGFKCNIAKDYIDLQQINE
jgi:hypothetical protein